LHLGDGAKVVLEAWSLGTARKWASLEMRWNEGDVFSVPLSEIGDLNSVFVPPPPGAGRHRLTVVARSPPNGAVVLDRFRISKLEDR
jgi:hypothetical protein